MDWVVPLTFWFIRILRSQVHCTFAPDSWKLEGLSLLIDPGLCCKNARSPLANSAQLVSQLCLLQFLRFFPGSPLLFGSVAVFVCQLVWPLVAVFWAASLSFSPACLQACLVDSPGNRSACLPAMPTPFGSSGLSTSLFEFVWSPAADECFDTKACRTL